VFREHILSFGLRHESKISPLHEIISMNLIEKGFVFGASEDGTIYYRPSRNQYNIEIEQKVPKWLEIVKKSIQKTYNKNVRISKTSRGYFRLLVYSKQLHNDLKSFRKDYSLILTENKNFQIGFLRGFFDAEGTVHNKRYSIRVSSKNRETILVIKKMLNNFNIKTGKIHADKTAYVLPLYGKENLRKFDSVISFRHEEKEQRLSNLLSA